MRTLDISRIKLERFSSFSRHSQIPPSSIPHPSKAPGSGHEPQPTNTPSAVACRLRFLSSHLPLCKPLTTLWRWCTHAIVLPLRRSELASRSSCCVYKGVMRPPLSFLLHVCCAPVLFCCRQRSPAHSLPLIPLHVLPVPRSDPFMPDIRITHRASSAFICAMFSPSCFRQRSPHSSALARCLSLLPRSSFASAKTIRTILILFPLFIPVNYTRNHVA